MRERPRVELVDFVYLPRMRYALEHMGMRVGLISSTKNLPMEEDT
jgi:hypothetical protein